MCFAVSHAYLLLFHICFAFFVCLFATWIPCGRYFTETQKKMKPKSYEMKQRSLRESLIIYNSSLWSLAASQLLKCTKHPCILMINSPFGLASSCIFLLVAIGRVLTDSGKAKKEWGWHAWKGSGGRKGSGHESPGKPWKHSHLGPEHSVGSMKSLRRLTMIPVRGPGEDTVLMISISGALPRADLLKV